MVKGQFAEKRTRTSRWVKSRTGQLAD